MTTAVRRAIAQENSARKARGGQSLLTVPSRTTLYEIWNEFPAFDRAVAKYGHTKARAMFRGRRGFERAEACLDHVEYDETLLPFFFFDEGLGVPLGRAWLAWYIDVYSQIPVGFYIGFEPPSDLTITSALRHACTPKSYVAEEYPDIVNEYIAAGIPRAVTFDNGLSQWGVSIEQTAAELGGMEIRFATARTPWFKPQVEGAFDVLNDVLLRELPGFVLAPNVDRRDYDPTKQGCIGIRHFLWIFHLWLIDVYCQTPRGPQNLTPAQRWREGTKTVPPDFIGRARDMEVIFGTVRAGTLDHRGVAYETLRYYSDDLHEFRLRDGSRRRVRVKINPADLGTVHVWDAKALGWIRAHATDQSYARGLSLHRHKLNRRFAKEQFGSNELEALLAAEDNLRATISQALPMALSIRANTNIARALGVGTQHIFGSLDAGGRLGPLSGPFEGHTLNPIRETSSPPRAERPARPDIAIPRFAADRSMRRPR